MGLPLNERRTLEIIELTDRTGGRNTIYLENVGYINSLEVVSPGVVRYQSSAGAKMGGDCRQGLRARVE